jgi:hypothetical protein
MNTQHPDSFPGIPRVVHVGFAGSRYLHDDPVADPASAAEWDGRIGVLLKERLQSIPAELKLSSGCVLCGISQLAIGADTLFTLACSSLGWLQRVYLPQPLDGYLSAIGSTGVPDFSAEQRARALELLESRHVIQQVVVSTDSSRRVRFEETNLAIMQASDILVCLLRKHPKGKAGGTQELLELASSRRVPVLELRLVEAGDRVSLVETWHHKETFSAPSLPAAVPTLGASPTPAGAGSAESRLEQTGIIALKAHASTQALRHRGRFALTALTVIGAHVIATLCATMALISHARPAGAGTAAAADPGTLALLALELALLVTGFLLHRSIHSGRVSEVWATNRLVAEICRSVLALGRLHMGLGYLLRLGLRESLTPLIRSLEMQHLLESREARSADWKPLRDAYAKTRLDPANKASQPAYYQRMYRQDARTLWRANALFLACNLTASAATAATFFALAGGLALPGLAGPITSQALGALAIVLPVLAVGALSWATSKDLQARTDTYRDMLRYLGRQRSRLESATSRSEFQLLVEETETRLLREVIDWYSRCRFRVVTPVF